MIASEVSQRIRPHRPRVGGANDWWLDALEPSPLVAPTEFISVERMIPHYDRQLVANHCLHRDKLGGGQLNSCRGAHFTSVCRGYARGTRRILPPF